MGNYYVKPRIYMEREGLREILKGVTRAFIVTDKFMHESGKVSYLTDVLEQMGIAYEIFSEVKPDPDIATVTKGIGLMTDFKPQALLALGGGRRNARKVGCRFKRRPREHAASHAEKIADAYRRRQQLNG